MFSRYIRSDRRGVTHCICPLRRRYSACSTASTTTKCPGLQRYQQCKPSSQRSLLRLSHQVVECLQQRAKVRHWNCAPCKHPQRHMSSVGALQHTRSRTRQFFLRGLKMELRLKTSRLIFAPLKRSFVVTANCIHRLRRHTYALHRHLTHRQHSRHQRHAGQCLRLQQPVSALPLKKRVWLVC